MDLNHDDIRTALKYLNDKARIAHSNETELARRMGINPKEDLLIIPRQVMLHWQFIAVLDRLPPWIKIGSKFELLRGVRQLTR